MKEVYCYYDLVKFSTGVKSWTDPDDIPTWDWWTPENKGWPFRYLNVNGAYFHRMYCVGTVKKAVQKDVDRVDGIVLTHAGRYCEVPLCYVSTRQALPAQMPEALKELVLKWREEVKQDA